MRDVGIQDEELDQAGSLMAAIRYQVFLPPVTTMGDCPHCGKRSRGSAQCADCLSEQLDEIVGAPTGARFLALCRRQLKEGREGVEEDHV